MTQELAQLFAKMVLSKMDIVSLSRNAQKDVINVLLQGSAMFAPKDMRE